MLNIHEWKTKTKVKLYTRQIPGPHVKHLPGFCHSPHPLLDGMRVHPRATVRVGGKQPYDIPCEPLTLTSYEIITTKQSRLLLSSWIVINVFYWQKYTSKSFNLQCFIVYDMKSDARGNSFLKTFCGNWHKREEGMQTSGLHIMLVKDKKTLKMKSYRNVQNVKNLAFLVHSLKNKLEHTNPSVHSGSCFSL